jgi:hypothetical protein
MENLTHSKPDDKCVADFLYLSVGCLGMSWLSVLRL